MFAALLRNIAITGVAYLVISTVGLLLAPLLIATYGIAGYGQILLARVVLPSAAFGVLDLGVGESTTRIIAFARADDDWTQAGRAIGVLVLIALAVSVLAGLALALLAPRLADWLSIAADQQDGFVGVLRITALILPVLFLSLVAEGVLKGFEAFRRLRSCEVASAVAYASLTLLVIAQGRGPNSVSLALLAGLVLRAAMAGAWAVAILRTHQFRLHRPDAATRRDVFAWSRTMMFAKLIGTAQTQVQAPLLGLIIGPAAVGIFDAIVRLPRFVKSIFALISATVMPLAARLRAQEDQAATRRLTSIGMLGAYIVCLPPAAMAAAFSFPILLYWLGERVADYWQWQALMFMIPVINVVLGFGGSVLLAERRSARALNRLSFAQVALQLSLSLALLPVLEPWSFVLGQVVSVLLLAPFQLQLIRRELNLPSGLGRRVVAAAVVVGAMAAAFALALPRPGLILLLILLATGSALGWLAAAYTAMDREQRHQFLALVRLRAQPVIAKLDRRRREPERPAANAPIDQTKPPLP